MPLYVTLANWTDQGARDVKDSVKRADAFAAAAEKSGCKVHHLLWTMGPHDIVAVVEAPNDAVFSGLVLGLGKLGNVRGVSMRAFTKDEMRAITQTLP